MEYRVIPFSAELIDLLPRPQQPFDVIGKLVPLYDGVSWSWREELFAEPRVKTYPDEDFDPAEYIDNPEQAAFLAMRESECVGSLRVCRRWNGGAFVDDLAIDLAHRGRGLGRRLMDAAVNWAKARKLVGMSLETQDRNLLACRFYIKYGFKLGGIDTKVYARPDYRGETALYFYLDW